MRTVRACVFISRAGNARWAGGGIRPIRPRQAYCGKKRQSPTRNAQLALLLAGGACAAELAVLTRPAQPTVGGFSRKSAKKSTRPCGNRTGTLVCTLFAWQFNRSYPFRLKTTAVWRKSSPRFPSTRGRWRLRSKKSSCCGWGGLLRGLALSGTTCSRTSNCPSWDSSAHGSLYLKRTR